MHVPVHMRELSCVCDGTLSENRTGSELSLKQSPERANAAVVAVRWGEVGWGIRLQLPGTTGGLPPVVPKVGDPASGAEPPGTGRVRSQYERAARASATPYTANADRPTQATSSVSSGVGKSPRRIVTTSAVARAQYPSPSTPYGRSVAAPIRAGASGSGRGTRRPRRNVVQRGRPGPRGGPAPTAGTLPGRRAARWRPGPRTPG